MEQLLHAFGIDAKLIVIQVFNFGILMAALTYFLYKPVLNMLHEREMQISQGVRDAEDAAKAKASADEEKKDILAAAHKDAEEVSANAKQHADEKATAIVADAQTKAEGVVKDAESKGEEIKAQARKESEAEVAKLAVLAAEKVLAETK